MLAFPSSLKLPTMNAAIGDLVVLDILTQTPIYTLSGSFDGTAITLPKLDVISFFIGLNFGLQYSNVENASPTEKETVVFST